MRKPAHERLGSVRRGHRAQVADNVLGLLGLAVALPHRTQQGGATGGSAAFVYASGVLIMMLSISSGRTPASAKAIGPDWCAALRVMSRPL